jgi:sodium-dependent dicarboxylate transporter 2/3/5
MLNNALVESGFTKRVVTWFITRKIAADKPWMFIALFLFAGWLVGLILDVLPASMLMLTMAEEVFTMLDYKKGEKFPKAIIYGLLIILVSTYNATPISHLLPIMFIGFASSNHGKIISFTKWMSIGIPSSLLVFVLVIFFIRFIIKPDIEKIKNFDTKKTKDSIKKMRSKEKITVITFVLVVIAWLFPDLGVKYLPGLAGYLGAIGFLIPAVAAILALSFISIADKPIISFKDALSRVPLSLIVYMAGVNALGAALTADSTGITIWINNLFSPYVANVINGTAFVLIICAWMVIMTNFMSCGVVALLGYAVAVPIAISFPGMGINSLALLCTIEMAAGFGILTPPASGQSAILISTEWYTVKDSAKFGWPVMLIFIFIAAFVIYPLANSILPG